MYKSIINHNNKVDTGAANAAPPVPTYHQWLLLPRGGVEEDCVGTVLSDGISDTIASKQTDKLFLFLLEHDPDNVA